MSVIANDIDTKMVSLRISDTRSNYATHTLKERLIKDTSKYSCLIQSLYTDSIPPLLSTDSVLLAICKKEEYGDAKHAGHTEAGLLNTVIVAPYTAFDKLVLKRNNHWNILEVLQFVKEFINQFNTNLAIYGGTAGDGNNDIDAIQGLDPALPHDDLGAAVRHVGFALDSSGRGEFFCSDAFLSNYFIFINPHFAKLVGLPKILFGGLRNLIGTYHTGNDTDIVLWDDNDDYNYHIEYVSNNLLGTTFRSDYPVFLIDERDTLDIELTIPVSRIVEVLDSDYTEKFRLASFPIGSYIDTQTKITTKDGVALPSIRVTDSLQGGIIDLAAGYRESIVKHFMPGSVQAINTRIFCTYKKWDCSRVEKDFELDGFYDIELLFMKKVT